MAPPWLQYSMFTILLVICPQGMMTQSTCAFMTETNFDLKSVPTEPTSPTNLTICQPSKSSTCCTPEIEAQMKLASTLEIQRAVQDQIILVRQQFDHFRHLFNGHFRAALNVTRARLERMFAKSYGPFYLDHRQAFDDFFDELDAHHTTDFPNASVTQVIDRLFRKLFITMFTLMNPLKPPGAFEKECMAKHLDSIKPFGGFPQKMIKHMERAFVAWKFVGKAIERGNDVLLRLLDVKISEECIAGLTKMQHCHVCSGVSPSTKPCPGFCLNVLKGCFAGMAEIDPQWNSFLRSLLQISERLGTVYNPGQVMAPVPVQISEAIMYFQEKGSLISNRVIASCFSQNDQRPHHSYTNDNEEHNEISESKSSEDYSGFYSAFPLLRGKRAVKKIKKNEKAAHYSNELNLDSFESKEDLSKAKSIEKEITGNAKETVGLFVDRLARMKHFFRHLSTTLCTDRRIAAPRGDPICWNGHALGRYTRRVVGDGIASQRRNPEFHYEVNNDGTRAGYINVLPPGLRQISENTHIQQRLTFAALGEKLDALYRGRLSKEIEEYDDFEGSAALLDPDDEDNTLFGSGLPPEDLDEEQEADYQAHNKAHQDLLDEYEDQKKAEQNELGTNIVAAESLPIGIVTATSNQAPCLIALLLVLIATVLT